MRNLASPLYTPGQCEDGNGFALSMGTRTQDADRWNQRTCVQPSILSSDAISMSCHLQADSFLFFLTSCNGGGGGGGGGWEGGLSSAQCPHTALGWNLATPQDPTSWLLYRGGLIIQWNLYIVATPRDPTTWLLY